MSKSEWLFTALLLLLVGAIGLPYLQKSRESSRRNTCIAGLAQLAQTQIRQAELNGSLPGYAASKSSGTESTTPQVVSWVVPLLPYLGLKPTPQELEEGKYDATRTGTFAPLAEKSATFQKQFRLTPLTCPSFQQQGSNAFHIQFVANTGLPDAPATAEFPADWPANGVFQQRVQQENCKLPLPMTFETIEAADGSTTTLLFSENVDAGSWLDIEEFQIGMVWQAVVEEEELQRDTSIYAINEHAGKGNGARAYARAASFHPHGVNAVFADGHTQFIQQNILYEIWVRYATVDDTQLMQPGTEQLLPQPIRLERALLEQDIE